MHDALGRDKRSNGVDDDGNGYVDDWHGWDFVAEYPSIGVSEGDSTPGPDNDPQDNHGHGTHVAGTIAAQRDNNEGIAGVAPGAKIMPLRALGANGRGTSLAIAEAFDYAGKMGLRVVNASLGGPGLDQTQLAAVQAHPNTLYVIAAGNDNVNNDATPYGPCALPAANIMCVGASDENDRRASFSNYGANERRRLRARHGDPLDLHVARVRVPAGHVDGQPERGRRRGARAVGRAAARARSTSRARSWRPTDAKADLSRQVGHRRARQRRPGASAARSAARRVNVTPPVDHGHAPPGRRAERVDRAPGARPGPRTATSGSGRSTAARRWTAIAGATASTYTPGASDIGATLRVTVTATNPYGVASATSAAVGPVASGAPVTTSRPGHQRHAAPRPGPDRQRGLEPGRHVLRLPVAALDRRRHLDDDRHRRVELHAHDRRAGGARARDGHGDQRLRAGVGDQRPDRAGRVGPARQHDAAGHHRHDAADASR